MPREPPREHFADRATGAERAFVLALGGYSYDVAGASFVTHERIPVPRFNFVSVGNVGPDRQTEFFERALDHYFQRALRPTFRVPSPVPRHLEEGLARFSFVRRSSLSARIWTQPGPRDSAKTPANVRPADPADLDAIVGLWTGDLERAELRRSLDVLWSHPNPGESVTPLLAELDGRAVGGAVLYEHDGVAGLHGVATVPGARGRGIATALVRHAATHGSGSKCGALVLSIDAPAIPRPLVELGFSLLGRYQEFDLPAGAGLTLPDPGPAQPPRWRPPRARPGG